MLIDSDVLIWVMRGHEGAAQRVERLHPWRISVVTYIELAQGCRDKTELQRLKRGLDLRQTEVLQITPAISSRSAAWIEQFALSDGMRLADALIGATAVEHGLPLLTANVKHFRAIAGLTVEPFVP